MEVKFPMEMIARTLTTDSPGFREVLLPTMSAELAGFLNG